MTEVGMFEAKTHFSDLAKRVKAGEEITVTKRGEPVLRMVPVRESTYRAEEITAAVLRMKDRTSASADQWSDIDIREAIGRDRDNAADHRP